VISTSVMPQGPELQVLRPQPVAITSSLC
jgi:hypothetical protein